MAVNLKAGGELLNGETLNVVNGGEDGVELEGVLLRPVLIAVGDDDVVGVEAVEDLVLLLEGVGEGIDLGTESLSELWDE